MPIRGHTKTNMPNFTGSITINGVTDEDLVKILGTKIKHEHSFTFNPQQLQPIVQQRPGQPSQPIQHYNNASFNWQNEKGLEAVHQIISILLKKEESHEKQAA